MEYQCDIVNIAVVNFKPEHGDKGKNLKKIRDFTAAAAKRGADIILFPEMCLTGYEFFTDGNIEKSRKLSIAETVPGPSVLSVAEVTKSYGVYAVFGMPQVIPGYTDAIFNSAAVACPDGSVAAYQKIHPYGEENTWCAKGEKPFMFNTKWGPVSVGICYDTYHFPELMRYCAFKGSRLYLNLTAIYKDGSSHGFKEGYVKFLEYGVLCNHIFIASANLAGYDQKIFFGGGSMVIGPKMMPSKIIYAHCYAGDVDCDQEGIFIATVDLSLAKRTIFNNNPYTGVPDYRPDLYRLFE